MTQPGKRRREGIVEPPDLEGLYPSQKSVKRRRTGVVKPPILEELQLPDPHCAVPPSNGTVCSRPAENDEPLLGFDQETSNGVAREKEEDQATERTLISPISTGDEEFPQQVDAVDQPQTSSPAPDLDLADSKDKEKLPEKNGEEGDESKELNPS